MGPRCTRQRACAAAGHDPVGSDDAPIAQPSNRPSAWESGGAARQGAGPGGEAGQQRDGERAGVAGDGRGGLGGRHRALRGFADDEPGDRDAPPALDPWRGKRGQAGRAAPRGFPAANRFL